MAEIVERITLEQVRETYPTIIFHSVMTCWWTHDRSHLYTRRESGLPCDPRSGLLLEEHDVEGWLQKAEQNPYHYGKHGLRAFIAAHHLNCVVGGDVPNADFPTCLRTWDEYNEALDRLDSQQ